MKERFMWLVRKYIVKSSVDAEAVFMPNPYENLFFTSTALRQIADEIDRMNKPEGKQLALDLEAFATGNKNAITESP